MRLNEYLKELDLKPNDFAMKIGVAAYTVKRYLDGKRIPDPEVMKRIKAETNQKVTADSFYQ